MESFDHLWKEIVHVFATTALIWVGQEPPDLLQLSPPTPTQPFDLVMPTVTVYSPSRCLPVGANPSTLGNSSSLDAEFLHRILVILFGLSIFGFFSLAAGAFCLSFRATRSSSPSHTSLSSNVSPSLALSDDVTVRGAQAGLQVVSLSQPAPRLSISQLARLRTIAKLLKSFRSRSRTLSTKYVSLRLPRPRS